MKLSVYNEAQGFLKSPTMLKTEKQHNIDKRGSSLPLEVKLMSLGADPTDSKLRTRN